MLCPICAEKLKIDRINKAAICSTCNKKFHNNQAFKDAVKRAERKKLQEGKNE